MIKLISKIIIVFMFGAIVAFLMGQSYEQKILVTKIEKFNG